MRNDIKTPKNSISMPRSPGRPPKSPGTTKEVRASLRTTPERMAKADRLATAAGMSRNEWLEALIDAAPEGAFLASPTKGSSESYLVGLTNAQLAFMQEVNDSKKDVADYLRRGVQVQVVPNDEVPEAPPFALDVVENPSFWIGCFDSKEQATAMALALGLRLSDH